MIAVRRKKGKWTPCFGGMLSDVYWLPYLPCWLLYRAGCGPSYGSARSGNSQRFWFYGILKGPATQASQDLSLAL